MINAKFFMLCDSITEEESEGLDTQRWKANIKYDGERIISIREGDDIILINRRGKICNLHFPEIVEELKKILPDKTIVDGEIISTDDNFTALQSRALTSKVSRIKELIKEVPVNYMIFDLIKNKDKDIRFLELEDRVTQMKDLFSSLQGQSDKIKLAEFGEIKEMIKKARAEDREGLILKDMNGTYENRRSPAWKKLKFFLEGELKPISYEENPKGIRVEDKDGNAVQIAGQQSKPIKALIDQKKDITIYVQYLEKSEEGRMRFPSFRGLKEE